MARKRRILVERKLEERTEEDSGAQEIPEKFRDMGWKEWLRGPYARTWFVILSFFLDAILILEINRVIGGSAGIILSFATFIPLLVCEVYLYRLWWGHSSKSFEK